MPQTQAGARPVTQITVVDPEPGRQAEALSLMEERARFMAQQPGCLSIALHRSLDGKRIVNFIRWSSRDLLHAAHQSPEFRSKWGEFDALTAAIAPDLYEVTTIVDGARSAAP